MLLTPTQTITDPKKKTLATLANINSGVGHTASLFCGITVGFNVAKAMNRAGANTGVAVATAAVSGIATIAGISIGTEMISGAIRKKAGVSSPFSMLYSGQNSTAILIETSTATAQELANA